MYFVIYINRKIFVTWLIENIKVKIPSGVDTGTVIRLRGQGGEGMSGAPDGDLLVSINVEKHKFFKLV